MSVMAVDLSSHCGWASGKPGSTPRFGVWELPSIADAGRQAGAFADVFADAITVHKPRLVILEVDINLHRHNPAGTAEQQIGMAYLAGLICWRREVTMKRATASDARSAVLGRARWPEKGDAKAAVLAWCRQQGWDVLNHNAADALVLWQFACRLPAARLAA
jgi:hypothetical protein